MRSGLFVIIYINNFSFLNKIKYVGGFIVIIGLFYRIFFRSFFLIFGIILYRIEVY